MPAPSESTPSETATRVEATRRLYRSHQQRVVAGICGGLGEYFAIDPVWFRVGFVVLALGGGSGVLIYLLMWLILPEQPEGYVAPPPTERRQIPGSAIIGMVLMVVGSIALINTVAPWLGQYVWPIVLVAGGLALVLGGLTRDTHK